MKTVIMLSVVASVLLWPGPGLASNETEALVAKAKEIVTPRTVQGGKSLQDIFAWFAKVEQIGDAELNLKYQRPHAIVRNAERTFPERNALI